MNPLALLRLARPADWTKNLFVFPALLASGRADDSPAILASLGAFAAFCLTASGVYAVNDALDWRSDALHPVKRLRPIPSGQVSPSAAVAAGATWVVLGVALGHAVAGWYLAGLLGAYLALQAAYNLGLKRLAMLDVVVLSLGFVLRAHAGAAAIQVPASLWLLVCVFFICLFLAGIKRLCDLCSARREPGLAEGGWHSPAGYESLEEINWMLAVSAASALVAFLMYAMSDHAIEAAGPGARGFVVLTPLVVGVMYRVHRSARTGRGDSPLGIMATDPVIVGCTVLFAIGAVVFLYSPWAARVIQTMFGDPA